MEPRVIARGSGTIKGFWWKNEALSMIARPTASKTSGRSRGTMGAAGASARTIPRRRHPVFPRRHEQRALRPRTDLIMPFLPRTRSAPYLSGSIAHEGKAARYRAAIKRRAEKQRTTRTIIPGNLRQNCRV